jgi:hypothetical protein
VAGLVVWQNICFCNYNMPSAFRKLHIVSDMQGAWHFPNRAHTMVHGGFFW